MPANLSRAAHAAIAGIGVCAGKRRAGWSAQAFRIVGWVDLPYILQKK